MLAVHIESKIIFFTSELLQGFRLFFSGKFCLRLSFRLENGCTALKVQSPPSLVEGTGYETRHTSKG